MYKHILVPVDLNDQGFADKAVETAVWHARQSNATLHLINVLPGIHMAMVSSYFPKDAARKMLQDTQQQLKVFAGNCIPPDIVHHQHVTEGKTWTTILDYAERVGADLIIMPSHKRSRVDKVMLGSVAAKVVENSPIPVLVLKPQGHLEESESDA
ncbi:MULTISPECIES: universal stress protein [Photobacterium]|uniref:Universal stress protein n=1 Tax=Photobacterium ganghwense TaxID=320778 RepID=A0A0J1KA00_9GAMM|nr:MULTISPECIES: universal stress protein [Photobacterium]KLV11167.1 universal stress protein [Photobacterium ganghwense]MBV1839958.1 universal stress protein [Photobacterium ganghwense]PSU05207.1 universal stress protein [Photobacterium ganghwense]QSV13830.1 universal stress protein [Photobacterium ganghwense]